MYHLAARLLRPPDIHNVVTAFIVLVVGACLTFGGHWLSDALNDTICLARRELIIHDAACDAKLGFSTPLDLRRAMHKTRFLVDIIYFHSVRHFTTYILDRAYGHFYHFDTLGDPPYASPGSDQVGRMRCAVLAIHEMLLWARQPFHFDFFAIPISQQPDKWECGILGVFCLFLAPEVPIGRVKDESTHLL
ncbi:hypothetical protein LCI18_000706 [Fusarium solani-melongenae]|uniref:Uncharacterized protein n=1 Tax=Fusarium solani subsp. cucurbitae TaxID=2747967 RepID=A0ACD3YLG2_FUSSC|nr:hypothetical protein LCI18_000706 [Fusarium solani-melongenae]